MQLGFDAQNVIAFRMLRLAQGGARGQNEARRMVTEKIAAGVEAQAIAGRGIVAGEKDTVVAAKILRDLRKRVSANKRRLSHK
jgi:hypothetical protein